MDIRTLRYFVEVVRQQSFTRAAEKLFVTQPTISKMLKNLEDELNCILSVSYTHLRQIPTPLGMTDIVLNRLHFGFRCTCIQRRFRKLPLMPLVLTPTLLVMLLVFGNISWQNYIGEAHWLLWLLGPATIAFAVPVYDNRAIIKRHWMSLTAGVLTATVVAVTSSVWLARLFTLPDEIQRSLAVRSVTTPFALAASQSLGGQPDLVALFVVVTGVFGMAIGDVLFLRLSIREGMAKGAGFGAASHGAGTARSYELGQQEGVVASLVMMLSGVLMVLVSPLVARMMF